MLLKGARNTKICSLVMRPQLSSIQLTTGGETVPKFKEFKKDQRPVTEELYHGEIQKEMARLTAGSIICSRPGVPWEREIQDRKRLVRPGTSSSFYLAACPVVLRYIGRSEEVQDGTVRGKGKRRRGKKERQLYALTWKAMFYLALVLPANLEGSLVPEAKS